MSNNPPIKLLVITQYFWPENFRINDLASFFSSDGQEVTVITGRPNYPEGYLYPEFRAHPESFNKYGNVNIVRVPMLSRGKTKFSLALNYLSFFISASIFGLFKIRSKSYDVIFVYGASPITVAIPAILLKKIKKTPIYLWILDLWPESVSAAGGVKSKIVISLIGKLVSWIYTNCDHILIQSKSFSRSVSQYCRSAYSPEKVIYFPSWAEDLFAQNDQKNQHLMTREDNYFTIMFAGNIGEAQDFPAILNAAEQLKKNSKIRWLIVGDGRLSGWVAAEVKRRGLSECFFLLGRHSLDRMPSFYFCADALLVSLKSNEIFAMTIPGKIQSYLKFGKPIIGMIDGEAKSVIEESGAGRACVAGDSKSLATIVNEMSMLEPQALKLMGDKGRQYYESNFERNMLLNKLKSHFLTKVPNRLI